MHKKPGKSGSLLIQIDLEKAYNRVNWDFLYYTSYDFDFPHVIVSLIMVCVTLVHLSLVWNGSHLPSFTPSQTLGKGTLTPSHDLRQGNPLSPTSLHFVWRNWLF